MNVTLSDGSKIEVTYSDSHSGPDGPPGCQRCGSAIWFKLPGHKRFTRSAHRTMHRLLQWAELSNSVEEFLLGEL